MIKRLRRRFVLIAALSLLLVEGLIIGLINALNFYQINNSEDQLLTLISDNGGKFPEFGFHNDKPNEKYDDSSRSEEPPPKPDDSMGGELVDNDRKFRLSINEETKYRTRYFSVEYNSSLEPCRIDTGNIAAVTSSEALTFAEQADEEKNDKGYIDNYKYMVTETDGGGRLYVFLDCRENFSTKQRFLLMSAGISAGGYLLVCLLIIICSKFAVKPFIENFEKQKMFITDAGHEIKTPLAIISANTEVIELTSEPSEWTQSIKNQIERLNGLIANLLKLARMDEDSAKLTFAEFDMSAAFTDTAEPFKTLAATKGLSLDTECEEGIKVNGDEAALRQLVSILTENAVKYCDEGGSITASLKKSTGGRHVWLEVSNDCKEPPKNPDRLFDRFYRADSSRSRDNGETKTGYGIGLSVAKATCESHKGKISCRTENGRIIFKAVLRAVN